MTQTPGDQKHPSFTGRIGIARTDITPPVGIYSRNWGAAKHDTADWIHRLLHLSVLTITSHIDAQPLVLIDADLGWWRPLAVFQRMQRRILAEFSLDESRLIFALTHTHASAPLMDADPSLPGSELATKWLEHICLSAMMAIQEALQDSFDATLDWHTGRCGLASVRDLPDPNNTANRMVCGFNPNKKADDTLLLGRVTDSTGQLRATLVNYACHPTTLAWENTSISPDYIGAMRETMERDSGATAFFLLGACGDLAPRYQYVGDSAVADRHGRQLGHAALATLHDMEPAGTCLSFDGVVESGAPLAVWRHKPQPADAQLAAIQTTACLPMKDWPSADELEQQRQACNDRALEERLRRRRDIRRSLGDDDTYDVPVHAWKIGDVVWIGCCCEPYSALQQELRRRFPETTIVCMNLINGTIGYLPPADLYDTDVYPVWQTPFDRGCLEIMIEAMVKTIEQLTGKQAEQDSVAPSPA